ncbi:MAG: MerR family transcriptional regulator [Sphaerobacteraceae bacterium]|nr:MAG: MerR family transcriptional regulator [Sphaerobacteraceae bacterium]
MTEVLTIGQAAQRLGISSKTIRYYESIGLLPEMTRADNGYRRLNTQDVNRLRFIRRAKSLGLKLEEIRALTSAAEHGECWRITAELKDIVDSKIHECTRQIESLSELRTSLEQVSLRINTSDHEKHEHEHEHHHTHETAHTPFSPDCTCLPDALDLSLLGEGIR